MENEEDFKTALYVHASAKLKEEREEQVMTKVGDRLVLKLGPWNICSENEN